jgi:AraC-like DNA-binding protein/predicted transcriptional regulator YdeE
MLVTHDSPLNGEIGQQLERAILYIDGHLEEQITIKHVAHYACMSSFHFQRLFSVYLGETVSQYVLRRRLDFAAKKIIHHKKISLAELALTLSFETHSAFTHAFKKQFNITPSSYRNCPHKAKLLKDKSRKSIYTSSNKNKSIEVTVRDLPTLWFNHKRTNGAIDGGVFKDSSHQIIDGFNELLNDNVPKFYGLATSSSIMAQSINERATSLLYGGLYSDKRGDVLREGDWLELDAGLWAVCTHKGNYGSISGTWMNFVHSWLPQSGYELRDVAAFELYRNIPDKLIKFENLLTIIYLPIKKA